MLTQLNYCPSPIPASYIPLSKNKINGRAWGWALAAIAGDKVTPTVKQTSQEGKSYRVTQNSFPGCLTSVGFTNYMKDRTHRDPSSVF